MTAARATVGPQLQKDSLRQTWVRIGKIDLTSRAVLITVLLAHALTVFTFEAGRIEGRLGEVLLIGLLAEVVFWACYLLLYAMQIWLRGEELAALIKVAIIAISHSVRTLVLEFGYFEFGLFDEVGIADRILGDVSGIVILLIGIAYIQVVVTELGQRELELESAKATLLEQAMVSKRSATEADQMLRAKAQSSLGAQLTQITKYLKSAKNPRSERLITEIKDLVEQKVRPLSSDLWNRLEISSLQEPSASARLSFRLPKRSNPRFDYRGSVVFALGGLNIFITTPGLSSWDFAIMFGLVTLSYPVISIAIARLWPSQKSVPLWSGVVIAGFMATLSWLPSLYFLNLNVSSYPALKVLMATSFGVILLVAIVVAVWSAFKREQNELLGEIEAVNKERSRQLALLDQAVWVARRNWSFLVHGTVQGALTVAISRLQLADKITPELSAQVSKDIERAKAALEGDQQFGQSWFELLPQIKQTWDGVCELRHEITPAANQLLLENPAASTCVAEIAKELVSNAFRHGKATQVTVSISLDDIGDVVITSTNNGRPVEQQPRAGIGSEMFEELTSSWGWINTPKGPRFSAVVPVAINPEVNPANS